MPGGTQTQPNYPAAGDEADATCLCGGSRRRRLCIGARQAQGGFNRDVEAGCRIFWTQKKPRGVSSARFPKQLDQKPDTFKRPPVTVFALSDGVAIVAPMMADLMSKADVPGWLLAYIATAPVTCGVAIDVPL